MLYNFPIFIAAATGPSGQIGLCGSTPWAFQNIRSLVREAEVADQIICSMISSDAALVVGHNTSKQIADKSALPGARLITAGRFDSPQSICSMLHREDSSPSQVWVLGGEKTFKDWMPFADMILLAPIDYDGQADKFFPWKLDREEFL